MKNKILFILILSISFIGCNNKAKDSKVLSVSIEPQKYFLSEIVGDEYSVNTIIPAGSNPETYDPTPAQMVALGKSKAFFKVGYLTFENTWVNNIKGNTPDMPIVDCSNGIEPIEAHHCDDHSHGGGHDGADPHIWSSPKTAKIMIENMYKGVLAIDPVNEEYYTANYKKLISQIDSVDVVIRKELENIQNKAFIIYHPALSYFAQEYGLKQFSIETDGKSPSPSQLKQLVDLSREHDIKIVFIQAEYDAKNAETIANEIGAKVVSINLLSYNWAEEMIKIAKALNAN